MRIGWAKTHCLLFVLSLMLATNVVQASNYSRLQKLTVVLDWLPSPEQAPLFVAAQQGFYQQQGLNVNIITPADPTQPSKLVAANKADIAIDYQPRLLLEIAQGLPVKEVGVLVDAPLTCLIVLKNSSIHSLQDLKGKKIAYSAGGIDPFIVQMMLASQGLTLKDVAMVNVGYNLMQAVLTKNADAAIGLLRTINLTELDLLKFPGKAFYPEDYGFPYYDELVLIANKEPIHDARIKSFLAALKQGVDYLNQHPEASWQKFANHHANLNDKLNHIVWFNMLPYFNKNPKFIDQARCKRLASYLNQNMHANIPATACD